MNQSKFIAAERDLNVYKQVYHDLQHKFKELESSKALVEKQRDELEKASFPSIFYTKNVSTKPLDREVVSSPSSTGMVRSLNLN